MSRKARTKTEARKTPARLTAELAEWVGSQDARGSEGAETEGFRKPARLTAALAEWIGSQDSRALRGAFRRVGLEVVERKPEHHYVHEYYGHSAHKLRSGLQDSEFLPLAREAW